ncbi:DUF2339 domain-containing protein [Aestuariivirga litoralis]|uniref:DUF2339 domain-containing protein n=1 Tax=Aestuariivirga litoralis TaxID=2650924 RepID=UPI0018C63AB1|nr:DUF2339 domain-containing protein [Aestuariivirga litoralis]MBG1231694.1 DUF2339 domain-containing protein [Aestuariivirga litoralis]
MTYLLVLAALVVAVIALRQVGDLKFRLSQIETKLEELLALREKLETPKNAASPAKAEPVAAPTSVKAPAEPKPAEVKAPAPALAAKAAAAASIASARPEPLKPALPPPSKSFNIENLLTTRLFVWLGAAAVALAGLLFVRYAAQHNLVPPIVRILVGLLLGGVLVAVGEYARRSIKDDKSYVPAGLSAGGLVTAFGSVYAAYALYDLLGPTAAFIGLALVAFGGLLLSLRQGPLIAAVGLLGAYGAPAMVVSPHPQALGFFIYLFVILAACFAILRQRPWLWLGFVSVLMSFLWSMLWLTSQGMDETSTWVIGLFALALGTISVFAVNPRKVFSAASGTIESLDKAAPELVLALAGMAAGALILGSMLPISLFALKAVILFGIGMAGVSAFGWFKQGKSHAALFAAGYTLLVLRLWVAPEVMQEMAATVWGQQLSSIDAMGFVTGQMPRYLTAVFVALVGFSALGAAGFLRKSETFSWALLAAASPVLYILHGWLCSDAYLSAQSWAWISIAAAAALLGLAWLRREGGTPTALLIGASAILLVFAADRLTQNVWLVLVIAGLSMAYVLLQRLFASPAVARIAAALGAVASILLFARHTFAPETLDALPWGKHWGLYGYGVPVLLFYAASHLLRADPKNFKARVSFEGLSLGLAISLVSVELRALISGYEPNGEFNLLELGCHVSAWLGAAVGLCYRQGFYSSLIAKWGARVLLAMSGLALLFGCLWIYSPLFNATAIEGGPVFNSLILAYLLPAGLILLIARRFEALELPDLREVLRGAGLFMIFIYVSLAVMRLFEGPVLSHNPSALEFYVLTLAWTALAGLWAAACWKWPSDGLRIGVLALAGLLGLSWLLGNLARYNPAIDPQAIAGGTIFNGLWLGYLAPAVAMVAAARARQLANWPKVGKELPAFALLFVLVFLSLELKRIFEGPVLGIPFISDAESYAMSALWLVFAIGLLVAGFKRNDAALRYGGLAVMVLALAKTFIYDLWQLGGLWQIASVMGMGLTLVGTGWLYTRLSRKVETDGH